MLEFRNLNICSDNMAKRFISTELWAEDWFLEMPLEYKFFWIYITCHCDHAGIFKVNLRSFCSLNEVNINSSDAIKYFNSGKQRIRIISESVWFIEDFFKFQYGEVLNPKNRVHESIKNIYEQYNISLGSIRGLNEVKEGVKDIDIDNNIVKDINILYYIPKEYLREKIEVDLDSLAMKSGLSHEEFDFCLTQWSLKCEENDFKYTGDGETDLKKLRAGFEKWLGTWVKNGKNKTTKHEKIPDLVRQGKAKLVNGLIKPI